MLLSKDRIKNTEEE